MLVLYCGVKQSSESQVAQLASLVGLGETTAVRWIAILEQHGLVECEESVDSALIDRVRITAAGRDVMDRIFAG